MDSNWTEKVLQHIGGPETAKSIGANVGVSALFALGGYLTSGPLKHANPRVKHLLNAVFGVEMSRRILLPDLKEAWLENEVPDFVMTALTTTIAVLGVAHSHKDMIYSAAMLAALFSMAGALEEGITSKNEAGIEELEHSVPAKVSRCLADGSKVEKEIDLHDIKPGEHVFVKAGEMVPVDGHVVSITEKGNKAATLGMINRPKILDGEGGAMDITLGERLAQGSMAGANTEMVVQARVTAKESVILKNVEYLKASEVGAAARGVHSVKQIMKYGYIPVMLAACAAQFYITYHSKHGGLDKFQFGKKHKKERHGSHVKAAEVTQGPSVEQLQDMDKKQDTAADVASVAVVADTSSTTKGQKSEKTAEQPKKHKHHRNKFISHRTERAIERTTELAIKMAPCAITAAMLVMPFMKNRLASEFGVIVREDVALEKTQKIKTVLCDIRGTLTKGISKFDGMHTWRGGLHNSFKKCGEKTEKTLLGLVGKAEAQFDHPIAKSLSEKAKQYGHTLELHVDDKVERVKGGIKAVMHDGRELIIGNKALAVAHGAPDAFIKASEKEGLVDTVFIQHKHSGSAKAHWSCANFTDELRPNVAEAITELRKGGTEFAMVTGMPEPAARRILNLVDNAEIKDNPIKLYADRVLHSENPKLSKEAVVDEFTKAGKTIGAVGDADNDSGLLSYVKQKGGVSFAIAETGAAATKQVASVVIEGIHQLPGLMKVSKDLSHTMWMNVGAAGLWMSGLIGSHILGYKMKPQTAAIAHELPTFLITGGALMQTMQMAKGLPTTMGRA